MNFAPSYMVIIAIYIDDEKKYLKIINSIFIITGKIDSFIL